MGAQQSKSSGVARDFNFSGEQVLDSPCSLRGVSSRRKGVGTPSPRRDRLLGNQADDYNARVGNCLVFYLFLTNSLIDISFKIESFDTRFSILVHLKRCLLKF